MCFFFFIYTTANDSVTSKYNVGCLDLALSELSIWKSKKWGGGRVGVGVGWGAVRLASLYRHDHLIS
jgi:hypothetical protein